MRRDIRFTIPEGTASAKCRGQNCGAWIYWVKGNRGGKLCVNADGTPHWATCPDAGSFKKKRKGEQK